MAVLGKLARASWAERGLEMIERVLDVDEVDTLHLPAAASIYQLLSELESGQPSRREGL